MTVEFVPTCDPAHVETCLQDFARLESSGWKGKAGTAVTAGNNQGQFYKEILRTFCAQGEVRIYRLLLNGKTAACDLCLERDGRCIDLKTAYDEQWRSYSPDSLLMRERIRHQYTGGTQTIEFYGRGNDRSLQWTKDVRPLHHYNVYRFNWLAKTHRAWQKLST